ncbi:MAG: hypothetical protein AAGI45_23350 [Cyanobacteria bacterium P01_H01_bin.26]
MKSSIASIFTSSSGIIMLLAGVALLLLGLLPLKKFTLGKSSLFLSGPLAFWQRATCIALGLLFFGIHLYFSSGIIESNPPLESSISFAGKVCKTLEDYRYLEGERVFLRKGEFDKLALPIGSQVTLSTTVQGVKKSINLFLDSDTHIATCALRLDLKTRESLAINFDIEIEKPSARPEREWKLSSR